MDCCARKGEENEICFRPECLTPAVLVSLSVKGRGRKHCVQWLWKQWALFGKFRYFMYGSVPQGWVNGAGRSTSQKVTEERKHVKLMQMLIVCPAGGSCLGKGRASAIKRNGFAPG